MRNLPFEERAMWICLTGLFGIIAIATLAYRKPVVAVQDPPAAVLARLDALEARADAQAKIRCLNVQTDRMDLAIFPVENLGRAKVVKP